MTESVRMLRRGKLLSPAIFRYSSSNADIKSVKRGTCTLHFGLQTLPTQSVGKSAVKSCRMQLVHLWGDTIGLIDTYRTFFIFGYFRCVLFLPFLWTYSVDGYAHQRRCRPSYPKNISGPLEPQNMRYLHKGVNPSR